MKTDLAEQYFFELLENKLSPQLTYHNIHHTKYVLAKALHIAQNEGVTGEDLSLLRTGAVLHDVGFTIQTDEHEEAACKIALGILPQFDYNKEQIQIVCNLIMATKIPQSPQNLLEEILCDADLYYLGTDNFLEGGENLFKERKNLNSVKDRKEWIQTQIHFLSSHHYFTQTAINELRSEKEKNLLLLKNTPQSSPINRTLSIFNFISDWLLIVIGVIIAAFALKGFLVPNNFFDGGITGISLLIHELYGPNLGYVIVLANLPFIIMCIYVINYRFALKTLFCVLMLGICLLEINYPVITSDKLLVSIFGGFFLGVGIGLTMRAGCAVDGIEVLALYTWRRTSFTISEIILALNVIIFSVAAFHFGMPIALYSMLTYFTASKTVDYVVEGIEAYTGVTIISGKSEMIKDSLVNEMGRGITIYKGERGFLPGQFEIHNECDIIFTVITRLELRKLKNVVKNIDPNAFVFANTIKEASGGVIKRRHIN